MGLADDYFRRHLARIHRQLDQLFVWLLLAESVLACTIVALRARSASEHDTPGQAASLLGGLALGAALSVVATVFSRRRPGWWLTRHIIAAVQMAWAGLLIHLWGHPAETSFHVFGSLAFIALYRDWRLLPTASVVAAADFALRSHFASAAGVPAAALSASHVGGHALSLLFVDALLAVGFSRSVNELKVGARREAELERLYTQIELEVAQRTGELLAAHEALKQEMSARLKTERELRQAQKLESVGRLASGVAHEINTPVQFISDSVHFLKDAAADTRLVLTELLEVQRLVLEGAPARAAALTAADVARRVDLDYVLQNSGPAFERSLDGVSRVAAIVRSMKEFAHPDSREMTAVDLNRAIASTLTISRHEYKYVADLEADLGDLPPVTCHVGDFNQALLNLIVNAAHAIADKAGPGGPKGHITVRSRHAGAFAVISVTDTGCGIAPEIRERIFDPFFTTKEVGRGTGQGLPIARSVVVDKHRGELSVDSQVGVGTTFTIRLPIDPSKSPAVAA